MKRICSICVFLAAVSQAPAQTVTATVATTAAPNSIALNPVTNKIYLSDSAINAVTVLNGATDAAVLTVSVGASPGPVAVNATTNRVYVGNAGDGTVSVVDGATDKNIATVETGGNPTAIAINPATNRIYVAMSANNAVTVIDGATNNTESVTVGTLPSAVAVNPATNKIYVVNTFANSVTVIDGATNGTTTVDTGRLPTAVAINVATNRAYVIASTGSVTVIDGDTNAAQTVPTTPNGAAIAVNPVTNMIYAACGTSLVTIDGGTNTAHFTAAPFRATTIAVNPLTNQIYVAGAGSPNATPRINVWAIDGATNNITPLSDANNPMIMAVNPVTNRIYLATPNATDVAVLDGSVNTIVNVPLDHVSASVVNPLTRRIYALNSLVHPTVSVLDAATNAVIDIVPLDVQPVGIALNERTNKVYVLKTDNTVAVIDGVTDAVSTVTAGSPGGSGNVGFHSIAVDTLTNRIYVTNRDANSITVIDGATNATETVAVGALPVALAINPTTNRVYVANSGSGDVSVVDGATNKLVANVLAGSQPAAVAVNPRTNQIYAISSASNDVTAIDGRTNATSTIPLGGAPVGVAVDPVTNRVFAAVVGVGVVVVNPQGPSTVIAPTAGKFPVDVFVDPATHKVYAPDFSSSTVAIIDGLSGAVTSVLVGVTPLNVAVDDTASKVYVSTRLALVVLSSGAPQNVPLTATTTPLPLNQSATPSPTFSIAASSGYAPLQGVYYQVDDRTAAWTPATATGPGQYAATPQPQSPGLHVLYTFAADGQDSTSVNTGVQSAPLVGNYSATPFFVLPPGTPTLQSIAITPASMSIALGFPVQLTATGTFSDGTTKNITAEVSWTSSNPAVAVADEAGVITPLAVGSTTFTATLGGLIAPAPMTVTAPVFGVTIAPAGPVTMSGRNYALTLRISNTGNVSASSLGFTSIRLNTAAAISLIPGIGVLAPGDSVTVPFVFPPTAGVPGSGAVLRATGSYTATLPGGATQPETFQSGSRVMLP